MFNLIRNPINLTYHDVYISTTFVVITEILSIFIRKQKNVNVFYAFRLGKIITLYQMARNILVYFNLYLNNLVTFFCPSILKVRESKRTNFI
jgi:hypothetical protein